MTVVSIINPEVYLNRTHWDLIDWVPPDLDSTDLHEYDWDINNPHSKQCISSPLIIPSKNVPDNSRKRPCFHWPFSLVHGGKIVEPGTECTVARDFVGSSSRLEQPQFRKDFEFFLPFLEVYQTVWMEKNFRKKYFAFWFENTKLMITKTRGILS